MAGFEPKVIAFACNWCSYAGADLAGTSHMHYPPNLRIVRLMCSGMVDPVFVLKALEDGFDGVLIAGCHIGDCHYISGNVKAEKRVSRLKQLLHTLGVEDQRLRLEWISAAEGEKFARTATDFVSELKALGASPLNKEQPA